MHGRTRILRQAEMSVCVITPAASHVIHLTYLLSLYILLPYDITCSIQDALLISGSINLSRCEGILDGKWVGIPACHKEARNVGPSRTR